MSKRILLVDDEEDLAFAVKMHLEAKGFEVLTAVDGQQGLDMARSQNPDLILLDVMLPKIEGYKVCRMLKFDEKYKHIPIILCTARGQEGDKQIGHEVGANAYVVKPFDSKKLVDQINTMLGLNNG